MEYYVSPTGTAAGDGSIDSPWSLAHALSHPAVVRPGDTIWLRGGIYAGQFQSRLTGTADAPIRVRQYPGERATIDAAPVVPLNLPALFVQGAATWFEGFEITNTSQAARVVTGSNFNARALSVTVMGPDTKFINCVVHDCGGGFGLWSPALRAELYGNIIYYNGWSDANRGHGEGVYLQNPEFRKLLRHNVIFMQCDSGVMAYGTSDAALRGVDIEENAIFLNGIVARDPSGWGILAGGGTVAEDFGITGNCLYNPVSYSRANNMDPAYRNGSRRMRIDRNYSAGLNPVKPSGTLAVESATGNTFIGRDAPAFPHEGNRFLAEPPRDETHVAVWPNKYDPARAYVVVYNWPNARSVAVDMSALAMLTPGDRYEVRAVQNYYGAPVVQALYSGGPVMLPMDVTEIAAPAAPLPSPPVSSFPTFGVFEVRITENNPLPEPEPPPPPPPPEPPPEPEPEPEPVPEPEPEPEPEPTPEPTPEPPKMFARIAELFSALAEEFRKL